MQLYGALISPFVHKVALAASEKGVSYDLVRLSPHAPDPGFAEASPFRKIPAIRDGDFTLADSSAIVAWLERRHPAPALFPHDAEGYGRAVWFDEFADTILGGAGLKVLFHRLVGPKLLKIGGDEAIALQGEAELAPITAWFEDAAPDSGWLLGADFGIADIAVASLFRSLCYVGHAPDPARHPRTAAWYERVCARPSWQAVADQESRC